MSTAHTVTVTPGTAASPACIHVRSIATGELVGSEVTDKDENPALFYAVQRIAALEDLCSAQQREIDASADDLHKERLAEADILSGAADSLAVKLGESEAVRFLRHRANLLRGQAEGVES
ncbi:hypothetical protein P8631_00895 [Guyparkeria sp. 1SP6A2]|nr:hypothetical protein [Guyparkeria sp. 1SP6A2]